MKPVANFDVIRIFSTTQGPIVQAHGAYRKPDTIAVDAVFQATDPVDFVETATARAPEVDPPKKGELLAPIGSQEVWAAGVTYLRSRAARMEESKDAGGGDFYDRVYDAERPELFFKATPVRVAGPGANVRIRSDSKWNVPEPELTLAINSSGRIFGFTVGNDMSSRDIEGQNPLYLPQAKIYADSAALGPCLVVTNDLPSKETQIAIEITRAGMIVFSGTTEIGQMKRPLPLLAEFLYRDNRFPSGAYLMTGTGIVPPDSFTLAHGDEIRITIEPAGTLTNTVA